MALKTGKNGKKYYYYYKKKVGRKKKRGPKPKPKKRGRSWQQPWDYKIIKCTNRKQIRVIGVLHNRQEVEKAVNALKEKNEKVIVPCLLVNNRNNAKTYYDLNGEYVILEKIRDEKTDKITQLRNEYGRLVDQISTNKKWRIYDKMPCYEEEHFWVYGYHPTKDRKTIQWVYKNFIETPLDNDQYLIIRIIVYYNKVIMRYDFDDINFVICKNHSEAIRFYNGMQKLTEKNKRVIYIGKTKTTTDMGRELVNIIMNKTGWDRNKVLRRVTL